MGGVFEVQKLLHRRRAVGIFLAQIHVDQAPVAANAVGAVDHRVAHLQFRQVFDERFDVADLFLFFAPARGGASGKQLGLGDEINPLAQPRKAFGDFASRQAQRGVAGAEGSE